MTFNGYNQAYLEEYGKRAATPLGRRIYKSRWNLVQEFCPEGMLFDYGCADGAFIHQAPGGYCSTGWDINPQSLYHENQSSFSIDMLTMWDVIEHLPSPLEPIEKYDPEWVFICTPNAANTDLSAFDQWKHFKPLEHIHYYTPLTLAMSLRSIGYCCLKIDYEEGGLRDAENPEAIFTAVFKRCHKK